MRQRLLLALRPAALRRTFPLHRGARGPGVIAWLSVRVSVPWAAIFEIETKKKKKIAMIIHEDSKSMYDEFCAKVRGVRARVRGEGEGEGEGEGAGGCGGVLLGEG